MTPGRGRGLGRATTRTTGTTPTRSTGATTKRVRSRGVRPGLITARQRALAADNAAAAEPEEPPLESDDGPTEDDLPELPAEDDAGADERDEDLDSDWAPRLPPPRLSIWATRSGYRWSVSSTEVASLDPAQIEADVELEATLERLAHLLIERFPAAVQARRPSEVLRALSTLPAKTLATELNVPQSTVTRLKLQFIQLPCGLLTVDCLTWLGPAGAQVVNVDAVIDYARAAADLVREGGPEPAWSRLHAEVGERHGLQSGTVRKYRPTIEAALRNPVTVRRHQAAFPLVDERELSRALGDMSRNQKIRQMFLAGCLDDALAAAEQHQRADRTELA